MVSRTRGRAVSQRGTARPRNRETPQLRLKPPRRYPFPFNNRKLREKLDQLAAVAIGSRVGVAQHLDLRLILGRRDREAFDRLPVIMRSLLLPVAILLELQADVAGLLGDSGGRQHRGSDGLRDVGAILGELPVSEDR